jgi:hypothetical protein
MMLIVPVPVVVIGALTFRKLIWNLADEVRDGGSYLLVRKGGIEQRVPLADVMNVSFSRFNNPPRVTLLVRHSGELGREITFIPKTSFFRISAFARNPIVDDLIERVDQARMQARA